MDKQKIHIFLILILVLGTLLRLNGLGDESFWLDESYTAEYRKFSIPEIIKGSYADSTLLPQYFGKGAGTVPAYYLITNTWIKLVGISEFKLRFISAAFGIISIYLIFILGKLMFNNKIGLIAAFLMSINHQQIYFSQEARMYSMLIALTLLSVITLIQSLKTNKPIYWIGFIITNTILLYTHYFSFFILFFEFLFIFTFIKKYIKNFKQIFISGLTIFILYIPWIPALINQVTLGSPTGRFAGSPTIINLITALTRFNSWISPDLNTRLALRTFNIFQLPLSGWILIISVILITIFLILSFIYGLLILKFITKDPLKYQKLILLLFWLIIPIFIPFAISVVSPKSAIFSSIRYIIFASPPYYLIASLGISKLKKFKPIFLLIIVILSISPLYSYYTNFDNQQWREAVDFINQNPNEFIIIQKENGILPFKYYHPELNNVISVDNLEQFIPIIKNKNSFWLILALEKFTDPQGLVKKYADLNFKLIEEKEFTGIKVYHYTK